MLTFPPYCLMPHHDDEAPVSGHHPLLPLPNADASSSLLLTMLPSELLSLSLLSYGNYGTMAKLACVQSSWKNLLVDDGGMTSSQPQHYHLANALIHGTHGLKKNRSRGIRLLQQLTRIPIDNANHNDGWPLFDSGSTHSATTNVTSCGHCGVPNQRDMPASESSTHCENWKDENDDADYIQKKAMKKLAHLYLNETNEEEEKVEEGDQEEEEGIESNNRNNTNNKNKNNSNQQMIGLQWLLCAFHIGNDTEAAYELATIYEYGSSSSSSSSSKTHDTTDTNTNNSNTGIPMDLPKAIYYLQQAATRGHVESMVELALHYELGCHEVCPVQTELAYYWYHQAAQRGHVIATYSLGDAYERGIISSVVVTPPTTTTTSGPVLDPFDDDDDHQHHHSTSSNDSSSSHTNANMTLACLYYYQAAMEGNDEDSITALRRLYDIARIVIPGIHTKLLQFGNETDKKERLLTNE